MTNTNLTHKGRLDISREIVSNELTSRQISRYAKIGIIALVDEATGYQKTRPRDDLRQKMKVLTNPPNGD